MYIRLICLILCYWLQNYGEAANILGMFIYPSYSHQIVYQAIWCELANRGHQVIVFTPNPRNNLNTSNLREIDISFMYEMKKVQVDFAHLEKTALGKVFMATQFKQAGIYSEKVMQHPEMQALLKKKKLKFDLLMVDILYPSMVALSIKFKCPYVGISPMKLTDPIYQDMGQYYHPVLYPSYFFPIEDNLSFWDRLQSVDMSLWLRRFYDNEVYPTCDKLVKKYLGDDYPPVKKIMGNYSLCFIHSNPVFTKPRPNVPNVIEFSGLHLQTKKSLPDDIKLFLNDSNRSVIYFSLGSNVKSNMLPEDMELIIFETFQELPYKFLVKFEQTIHTNLPENIKVEKWLPQQDVLSHPNVKMFITQGGQQSLEEAMKNQVPVVGIPFFSDQWQNMYKTMNLGIGKMIEKKTLTKETFKKVIIEVAENEKYREKMKELAKILEDNQVQPLDKVMWWIEYVIRHKGCTHLRSPLLDMPTYEYLMLDILAFVSLLFLTSILLIYYLYKYVSAHFFQIFTAKLKSGKRNKFE